MRTRGLGHTTLTHVHTQPCTSAPQRSPQYGHRLSLMFTLRLQKVGPGDGGGEGAETLFAEATVRQYVPDTHPTSSLTRVHWAQYCL